MPSCGEGSDTSAVRSALQPKIFAAALLGSSLFAVMTVASAYVIGEITERVVLPSFDRGSASTGALALAVVAIMGVALLRIVGIIGRRLCCPGS